ncbi:MAG: 2-oxo acid dehydrogenase subunit E2, partial [Candidatus Aenigmarchaeota archaeon]|nr:2-oxo acid dehydrogenase subunit E2 [Candidatus Aenigmarchaeota archaeon]
MTYEFKFPDVGEGIHEGTLVKWRIKAGDTIKEHDIIADVETDKAVVEVPSPKSGTVAKLNFQPGQTINVGDVMAVISEEGEPIGGVASKVPESKPTSVCQQCGRTFITSEQRNAHVKERHGRTGAFAVGELEEAPEEPEEKRVVAPAPSPHVLATPAVRALAKEHGIDIENIKGTGPGGRVTEDDVRQSKTVATPVTTGPKVQFEKYGRVLRVAMSPTRRAIAKHMVQSAYTAPHVAAMDDADVTELWAVRAKEKEEAEKKGYKLTFLPFIVKACLAALKKHPHFNASLDETTQEIVFKKYYNIGVAVHTGDGLMVPVVKDI